MPAKSYNTGEPIRLSEAQLDLLYAELPPIEEGLEFTPEQILDFDDRQQVINHTLDLLAGEQCFVLDVHSQELLSLDQHGAPRPITFVSNRNPRNQSSRGGTPAGASTVVASPGTGPSNPKVPLGSGMKGKRREDQMDVEHGNLPNPSTSANIPDPVPITLRPDQHESFLRYQEEIARRMQEEWNRESSGGTNEPFFEAPMGSNHQNGPASFARTPHPTPSTNVPSARTFNRLGLIPRERDVTKLAKAAHIRKIPRFNGSNPKDASIWCTNTAKAFQVLGTDDEPVDWAEFSSLMIRKFPTTLNKASVLDRFAKFAFRPNEKAVDAYGRFRLIQNDADTLKLKYEVEELWMTKLPHGLRKDVQIEVDRSAENGIVMNLEQIVLCSINRDNRRQQERDTLHSTSDSNRTNYEFDDEPQLPSTKRKSSGPMEARESKINEEKLIPHELLSDKCVDLSKKSDHSEDDQSPSTRLIGVSNRDHGDLTVPIPSASSPASEPRGEATGDINDSFSDVLATIENDSGLPRVDFILTQNKMTVRVLIDTGAKTASYVSKAYVGVEGW
ncbi:uncharacterized protein MELLADRAFT_68803 [Melampsora larici-populina 98AG31]|uniref:Retrotransposon gag domain-containing protein n=1 Tax=Melampsora larici-populina (strain 98AG31 / pathotype 3-4-7) TaxID=747676 RepID=F4S884_MELLP|nr:uncharacterized protein MELLADRAFT_68803 [Melampsora larici-populina 98AG31]EGF99159.1 hypothetical protein MELLADRAFT_68803 [Melampsora larici-populina 98AG31]